MRHIRKLLAAAVCMIPALASSAASFAPSAVPFDIQVYDRTENRTLPTHYFNGRTYVVGKPGNEYSLSLRNQSGERVLAVASVDGVNIVSGETASPAQTGYVLSPGQSADIKGWRKSLANTAAFYFTEHDNSYAARTGRPNDVGVIGLAVFRERRVQPQPPVTPPSPYRRYNESGDAPSSPDSYGSAAGQGRLRADSMESRAAPSAPAQAPSDYSLRKEKSLGTGHGRIEDSRTRYTDFQRASSSPEQVITVYYDTYANLLAMGVPLQRDDDRYGWRKPSPRPFPRDPTLGFVPDPR